MKVLITCDLFPPDLHGGTEFVAYKTAEILKKNGHEVLVICWGNPKIKEYNGIRTIRIRLPKQFLANILWFPIVLKFAKSFDVIHNFTFDTAFVSLICAKLLRKYSISSIQGIYGDAWIEMRKSWLMGKIRKFFEKLHLRLPFDRFHIISEYSFRLGLKLGLRKNRSIIIPWGIEADKYFVSKKEEYVLFIGRLVPQKGLEYLIKAAKRLPHVKFLIVGKGPERDRLSKISSPNVKFLGFVSEKEKRKLLSKALIFCLPSIGEGLGIVLLEAMASGCAIVSTIPFDYCGFTVEPRNVEQLVEKIDFLVKNKKIALRMGKENRKIVKKYKWENILKVYENIEKK